MSRELGKIFFLAPGSLSFQICADFTSCQRLTGKLFLYLFMLSCFIFVIDFLKFSYLIPTQLHVIIVLRFTLTRISCRAPSFLSGIHLWVKYNLQLNDFKYPHLILIIFKQIYALRIFTRSYNCTRFIWFQVFLSNTNNLRFGILETI